jgi:hypothetical protein
MSNPSYRAEDATVQQLGVFYGRSDPNTAGHTGFLTIDEARQMAVDFARLPELLKQSSAGSEVAKAHISVRNAIAHAGADAGRKTTPRQLDHLQGNLALRRKIRVS